APRHRRVFHSFPTRRSSDLEGVWLRGRGGERGRLDLGLFLGPEFLLGERGPVVVVADPLGEQRRLTGTVVRFGPPTLGRVPLPLDRKTTRLNSSHLVISYAV